MESRKPFLHYPLSAGIPTSRGIASSSSSTGTRTMRAPRTDTRALASLKDNNSNSPSVNVSTGNMTLNIPIHTSPSRSDIISPSSLSLSYASGTGNGPFGLGWSLNGGGITDSITRDTTKILPRYDDETDSDVFVLTGLDPLVPATTSRQQKSTSGKGDSWIIRKYTPRIQPSEPLRIERWTNALDRDDVHWRSISADNVTTLYGRTDASRITHVTASQKSIFSWLICQRFDAAGNDMRFEYKLEDGAGVDRNLVYEHCRRHAPYTQRYLKRILYGNRVPNRSLDDWMVMETATSDAADWMFTVVLDYGDQDRSWPVRKEPYSTHVAGFEIRTYRLCHAILVFHNFPEEWSGGASEMLVSSTRFRYDEDTFPSGTAVLSNITRLGHAPGFVSEALPPLTFRYSSPPVDFSRCAPQKVDGSYHQHVRPEFGDRATGRSQEMQWVDLDGEGVPGLLSYPQGDGAWWYQCNESPKSGLSSGCCLDTPKLVNLVPGGTTEIDGWIHTKDAEHQESSGLACQVDQGSVAGYYARTETRGWNSFVPFPSVPNLDMNNPMPVYMMDLTGDGSNDMLCLARPGEPGGGGGSWFPSTGNGGFGQLRSLSGSLAHSRGGMIQPAGDDAESRVCCADMTGDGLADLVCIERGQVTYWPNQGHGRFGERIAMGDAPPMRGQSNMQGVLLADVTGSGVADLILLGSNGDVTIYYNCEGNRWSRGYRVPGVKDLVTLENTLAFDLLGQGTTCLCWEDRHGRLRYLDLTSGRRAGLLEGYTNGLGLETSVTYCPSTKFYFDDLRARRKWATQLPFPVQCVESVTTRDLVAQKHLTRRYAYHNGYYDRLEREFRGFGMVEQWDDEAFGQAGASNSFHTPGTHQKTWFHLGNGRLPLPSSPSLESGLSPKHRFLQCSDGQTLSIDATRALKGLVYHHEIYGVGDSDRGLLPHQSVEQSYSVHAVQFQGQSVHRVVCREELTCHFDRTRTAPRLSNTAGITNSSLSHDILLECDTYGRPTKSASIHYGCADSKLTDPQDKAKQEETMIGYTEVDYTNDIDLEDGNFRAPVQCETRNYRILGARPPTGSHLYDYTSLTRENLAFFREAAVAKLSDDTKSSAATKPIRILVAMDRCYYRNGDLTTRLSHGKLETFSVIDQTFTLAISSEQLSLSGIPKKQNDLDKILIQAGGYRDIDGDTNYWIPSSRSQFSSTNHPSTPSSPAHPTTELQAARRSFYTPTLFMDTFGAATTFEFDRYHLLLVRSTDAVQNRTAFVNDYVHLTPTQTIDPNGNYTKLALDVFGRVVGRSVEGKNGQKKHGDNLDGFKPQLTNGETDSFLDNPLGGDTRSVLLKNAGERVIYGIDRYFRLNGRKPGNELNRRTKEDADADAAPDVCCCPSFYATITRHTHVSESSSPDHDRTKLAVTITYLDGTGRPIQEVSYEPSLEATWRFSGWEMVSDLSERQAVVVARKHAPFLSKSNAFCFQPSSSECEEAARLSTTVLRDPLGRPVVVLEADHTWSKTVHDSPWAVKAFGAGDTLLISDPLAEDRDVGGAYFGCLERETYFPGWYQRHTEPQSNSGSSSSGDDRKWKLEAAEKSKVYNDTPTVVHLDSLRRVILRVQDNGGDSNSGLGRRHYETRIEYDLWGNQSRVINARGVAVSKVLACDMVSNVLCHVDMDSGERWYLPDCLGRPLLAWDARGARKRFTYDLAGRPVEDWLLEGGLASGNGKEQEGLVVKRVYGEGTKDDVKTNSRGKLAKLFDQSGLASFNEFDFKGNCLRMTKQVAKEYKGAPLDWSDPPASWASPGLLEEAVYEVSTRYNAMNKGWQSKAPDGSVTTRTYTPSGRLQMLTFTHGVSSPSDSASQVVISGVKYSADGKRERIGYGNGVLEENTFDNETRELVRRKLKRVVGTKRTLRDVTYTHDCEKRRTHQHDACQQSVYFRDCKIDAAQDFTYDAIGQIVAARGRELVGGDGACLKPYSSSYQTGDSPGNGRQLCEYVEQYTYDSIGNILSVSHAAASDPTISGWTRSYQYNERSCVDGSQMNNRLSYTTVGSIIEFYSYNDHGCLVRMSGYSSLTWDFNNHLRSSSTQTVNNGVPETTYNVYDASGKRTRKVTERAATASGSHPTKLKETLYLPGGHQIYRTFSGDGTTIKLEKMTSLVLENQASASSTAVSLVEYTTQDNTTLTRYQAAENVELDDAGNVITYTEYSPFGAMTYDGQRGSASSGGPIIEPRKYRFARYERDTETGLYHCGERYYAAWLGRWTSPDPIGLRGGLNRYAYVENDPVNSEDGRGTKGRRRRVAGTHTTTTTHATHTTHTVTTTAPTTAVHTAATTTTTAATTAPMWAGVAGRGLAAQRPPGPAPGSSHQGAGAVATTSHAGAAASVPPSRTQPQQQQSAQQPGPSGSRVTTTSTTTTTTLTTTTAAATVAATAAAAAAAANLPYYPPNPTGVQPIINTDILIRPSNYYRWAPATQAELNLALERVHPSSPLGQTLGARGVRNDLRVQVINPVFHTGTDIYQLDHINVVIQNTAGSRMSGQLHLYPGGGYTGWTHPSV